MKRKIIAPIMALATACCCALGFTACADEPETPSEKEPEEVTQPTPEPKPETDPSQVTEEQWKTELANLKGLGEFKNYTIDSTFLENDSEPYLVKSYIDFENLCVYDINVEGYDYLGIRNTYTLGKHPVCDYYEIFSTEFGCNCKKTEKLDYDSAYNDIMFYSLLTTLTNIKSDGKTIHLEDAYDLFTYNTESKSFIANGIDILTEYDTKNEVIDDETGYTYWTYDYLYKTGNMEIAFNEDCYTVKISFEEYRLELTFKNFNTTVIELPFLIDSL